MRGRPVQRSVPPGGGTAHPEMLRGAGRCRIPKRERCESPGAVPGRRRKGSRLLSRKLVVRGLCRRGKRGEGGGEATKPTLNIERRGGKYELVSKCFEGVQLVGQSVLWVAMAFPS